MVNQTALSRTLLFVSHARVRARLPHTRAGKKRPLPNALKGTGPFLRQGRLKTRHHHSAPALVTSLAQSLSEGPLVTRLTRHCLFKIFNAAFNLSPRFSEPCIIFKISRGGGGVFPELRRPSPRQCSAITTQPLQTKMSVAETRKNAPNFPLPPYCCVSSGT